MSLRKNHKWRLIDIPVDFFMFPDIPRRQIAQRERHCNLCGVPIHQGEEHMAIWRKTDKFYPIRLNMCCICGEKQLKQQQEKMLQLLHYLTIQQKKAAKYIKDNELELKYKIYRDLMP